MGTRSAIGYKLSDGSIRAVYCHWDGYPDHQLPILRKHYNTLDLVKALIKPGSMSSLRTRNTWTNGSSMLNSDGSHMRDKEGYIISENDREPQPLYHHERGDKDCGSTDSHFPLNEWFHRHDCEHLYVFDPSTEEWEHTAEGE